MRKVINKVESIKLNLDRTSMFVIIFVIGVIIGSLFANLLEHSQINEIGLLNSYFIEKFENIKINQIDLFKYILFKRLKMIFVIWFFGITFLGVPCVIVYLLYFGVSFGFIISISVIQFSVRGIFLSLAYLFPHVLIYVPLVIYIMNKNIDFSSKLYLKKVRNIRQHLNKKQIFIEYIIVLSLCVLIVILGGLLESFINPKFLSWFIKKFI